MPTLRVGVDASGAKAGSLVYRDAMGKMRDANVRFGASGKQTQGTMANLSKGASGLARALGPVVSGFAAITASRAALRVLVEYEDQMATLKAVTGANNDVMAIAAETIRELGATTRFSAAEAASGATYLARAGFNMQQVVDALPATLDLASAGALGLGEAADIASNVVSSFRLEASDTARVVDILVRSANRANTDVRQMGEAFAYAGSISGSLNQSVEETAAVLGVLGNVGIQASSAGTNLRGMMTRLLEPVGKARKAIHGLGLTVEELNPETNTLTDIFGRLAAANLDANSALAIFGRLNVTAALGVTSQIDKLKELVKENKEAEGAAKEAAAIMNDTLGGAFKSLKSAVEEMILQVGDSGLSGGIKGLVVDLTMLVRAIGGNAEAIDALSPRGTALLGIIKLIGASVYWLSDIIGTGLGNLAMLFDSLIGQFSSVETGGKSSLGAVASGALTVEDIVDGLGATFKKVGAMFDVFLITPLANGIVGMGEILGGLKDLIEQAFRSPLSTVTHLVADFVTGILKMLQAMIDKLAAIAAPISTTVSDSLKTLSGVTDGIQSEVDAISKKIAGDQGVTVDLAIGRMTTGAEMIADALVPSWDKLNDQLTEYGKRTKEIDDQVTKNMEERNARDVEALKRREKARRDMMAGTMPGGAGAGAGGAASVVPGAAGRTPFPTIDPDDEQSARDTARLDSLRQSFMTEQQLLVEHEAQKAEFLASLDEAHFKNREEREQLELALHAQYAERRKELEKREQAARTKQEIAMWKTRLNMAQNSLQAAQQLLVAFGNEGLAESKAFGVAQAVISTAIGVARALELGYPAAIPAIAFAVATGAAQISAITGASKGSSGGAAGGGGGGASIGGGVSGSGSVSTNAADQGAAASTQPDLVVELPPGALMTTEAWLKFERQAQREGRRVRARRRGAVNA